MKAFGIVLIVLGIFLLVLPSLTFTKKEKVLDIGPIEAVAEKKESFPISPLLGICSIAAGTAIVVAAVVTKKN